MDILIPNEENETMEKEHSGGGKKHGLQPDTDLL